MPAIVRVNADAHQGHAGPNVPFHQTYYAAGSPTVFVNNEQAVRKGDKTLCGDVASGASSNVFINGILVQRKGDSTSGHGGWLPNSASTGSANVFAN